MYEFIKKIFEILFKHNMELEELIKKCSKKIDEKILIEKEKGLKYLGGTVKIKYDENNLSVNVSFELYFQDKNKNFFQTDGLIKYKAEYLSEKAIKKLKNKEYIEFEIDEPEIKSDIDEDSEEKDHNLTKNKKGKNK